MSEKSGTEGMGKEAGPGGTGTASLPSAAYRWSVLAFLGLAMFGNYYIYDSIAPVTRLLKQQLAFSDSNIGTLNAIYSFPNIIMVLISGVIIDRIGTKKSLVIFCSICLLGAAITASSGSFPMMAAGRLVFGLGAESMIVTTSAAVAKWFKGKELSLAFALKITMGRLGSFAAENSPTWLSGLYDSWQGPLLVAVGFGVLCTAAGVFYWVFEAGAESRFALGEAETEKVELRDILKFGASFWLIVALCMTFYSGIFPFKTFAIKFFQEARGYGLEKAGFLSSLTTMFALFCTPLFGFLADRIGRRVTLMIVGSTLLIPVYMMMGFTTLPLIIPMAMMGIAYSMVPAVMWPSVACVVPEKQVGTAYGLMTALQNVGLVVFNLGIGWANDHAGASETNPAGYGLGMIIFSFVGFFALAFGLLLLRHEKGPNAHGLETIALASKKGG